MKGLKEYSIPFKGLKEGKHNFDFELNNEFFEEFENSEIKSGEVKAQVQLTKRTQFLQFDFEMQGRIDTTCDRCLDDLELEMEYSGKLYVKFGDEEEEQSDELIVIPHEEHQFNLAQYMYDSIMLSLPYQRIHPEDEDGNSDCAPEMLERLNSHLIEEEIEEEIEEDEDIDPRWADLKKLLNNN